MNDDFRIEQYPHKASETARLTGLKCVIQNLTLVASFRFNFDFKALILTLDVNRPEEAIITLGLKDSGIVHVYPGVHPRPDFDNDDDFGGTHLVVPYDEDAFISAIRTHTICYLLHPVLNTPEFQKFSTTVMENWTRARIRLGIEVKRAHVKRVEDQ
jgi:hypothetical protein